MSLEETLDRKSSSARSWRYQRIVGGLECAKKHGPETRPQTSVDIHLRLYFWVMFSWQILA